MAIDFSAISQQFNDLQGRHPGLWPILPRLSLLGGVCLLVLAVAYFTYFSGQLEELDSAANKETMLKQQFSEKLTSAINLNVLRRQKQQVAIYVNQLEKQLPSRAEMDALLSEINQAGVARGLQFELFKPGQVIVKEFYAELPIAIKVVGGYHEVGGFVSDISNLARIVTLSNLNLQAPDRSGTLTLEAVAKTFRYLDAEEIEIARREALATRRGKAGAPPASGAGAGAGKS